MPFEIRIRERENPDNTIFSGQFPDAVTSFSNSNISETTDLIEITYQDVPRSYRVIKTIIQSDMESLAKYFLQSLESYPPDHSGTELYLKGALINDKAKKAILYISENDPDPKHIFIPILPRTNHDYIKIEDNCYRCEKIKFTKDGIVIIANPKISTFSDFEDHFFSRAIF